MIKETKEKYFLKISEASDAELIIINYELALNYMQESLKYMSNDQAKFIENINLSQKCISNLILSLNMNFEISRNLSAIYFYVNKLMIDTNLRQKKESLEEGINIISELLYSWKIAEKSEVKDSCSTKNSYQIYNGFTYNKSGICDYVEGYRNEIRL